MFWNIYNTPLLVSCILLMLWGLYLYIKNRTSPLARLFFFICLFTFFWQFSFFVFFSPVEYIVKNRDLILNVFSKICYFGIIALPVTFFHFTIVFTENYKKIKYKIFLGVVYLISLICEVLLIFTPYLVNKYIQYDFGVYPKAGILNPFFWIFVAIMTFFVVLAILNYSKSTGALSKNIRIKSKKLQIRSFLIAVIFYVFSSVDAIGDYGIPFYPAGYIFILIFLFIIGYAIVSYRLMDIKLVLRKSTVYIISLVLTLVPPVVLKYLGLYFLPKYYGWIDIVLLMIAVSLFSVLRGRVYRFANKYLFTSLYDSKKVIAGLSEHLSTTLVAKRLFSFIYKSLRGAFHMKAMAVLTFDKKGENLLVSYNHGFEPSSKRIPVSEYTKIYDSFLKHDKIIIFDELKSLDVPIIKKFVKEFNGRLGVEVLVPLNVKDKAIGVIAFGAKESGDIYNQEDIEVLKVISSQVAIALENATLYEQTKKFNIKLTKEVSRATADLQQANTELRKLDEAKSEFISIASHQLRTPLTVIKGYVSMMLEGSFGKLAPTVDENLYKVYESNERLIHLVENLLNISRIESGRLQFNFAKEDLTDTVASVVEELSHTSEMKKIYLKYSPPKEQIMVDMDEEKIRQVVINLIDNAIKYTKKGGVTVSLQKQADKAYFCVSDSGMGIAEKDLPNLFKKFSRGKDTSIVHTEGTGLGLFVGKMMIEAHKGKIWAESKGTAQGSKFCFTIPLINKQPPKTLEGKVV